MGVTKTQKQIDEEETIFADLLSEGLTKTFQMFIGEVDYKDLVLGKDEPKWLGRALFTGFLFLFVIVLTNLLNAIAIGDIEHLRQNSVAETNKKKIMDLLDQDPYFTDYNYTFEQVNRPAERRVENFWKYTWLLKKGKIGRPDNASDESQSAQVFLNAEVTRELKERVETSGDGDKSRETMEQIILALREDLMAQNDKIEKMMTNIEKIGKIEKAL